MDAQAFMDEVLARVPHAADLGQDPNPPIQVLLEGWYALDQETSIMAIFFPIAAQPNGYMQGYLRLNEKAHKLGWSSESGEVHLSQFRSDTRLVAVSGIDLDAAVRMGNKDDATVAAICREHLEGVIV